MALNTNVWELRQESWGGGRQAWERIGGESKTPKSRNLMSKGREECPKEENLVIRLLFDWIPQLESGPYTGDSDFYSVC